MEIMQITKEQLFLICLEYGVPIFIPPPYSLSPRTNRLAPSWASSTPPIRRNAITYHLVSGRGPQQLKLSLDANGSLSTAVVFDYEADAPTYSIRVQAKDEYNATVEGNFTVLLRDAFELNQSIYRRPFADLEMIWVEPGTFTMGSPTRSAHG